MSAALSAVIGEVLAQHEQVEGDGERDGKCEEHDPAEAAREQREAVEDHQDGDDADAGGAVLIEPELARSGPRRGGTVSGRGRRVLL